jgi:hypothetical protein
MCLLMLLRQDVHLQNEPDSKETDNKQYAFHIDLTCSGTAGRDQLATNYFTKTLTKVRR